MAAAVATSAGAAFNATVRITQPSATLTTQSARDEQSGYQQNDPVTGQPYVGAAVRGAVNTRHMPLLLDWEQ